MRRGAFFCGVASLATCVPSPARAMRTIRLAVVVIADASISNEQSARVYARLSRGLLREERFAILDQLRTEAILREAANASSGIAQRSIAVGRRLHADRLVRLQIALDASDSNGAFVSTHREDAQITYDVIDTHSGVIRASGTASGSAERSRSGSGSGESVMIVRRDALDAATDDLLDKLTAPGVFGNE